MKSQKKLKFKQNKILKAIIWKSLNVNKCTKKNLDLIWLFRLTVFCLEIENTNADFLFRTSWYSLCCLTVTGNPCERKMAAVAGPPSCHPTTCQNGGTPVYESNLCWCECPPSWQGDHDCSRPTMNPSGLPPSSNICKFNF